MHTNQPLTNEAAKKLMALDLTAKELTHPKHYEFCIGGGAFDTDGLWKPTKDGLGYARVLDYIGVRY